MEYRLLQEQSGAAVDTQLILKMYGRNHKN